MKVKDVICAAGRSGYMHRDLPPSSPGTATPDGSLFRGKPMSPGFTRIIEPATIISVMLVLEDGQIAFGDCADVILAGVAGRDPGLQRPRPHRLRARRSRGRAARPRRLEVQGRTPRRWTATPAAASGCTPRSATA